MAVYLASMSVGDTVLGMDLSHGGHLTHGSPVNFLAPYLKQFLINWTQAPHVLTIIRFEVRQRGAT